MHSGYIGLLQNVYLAGYAAGELQAVTEAGAQVSIPADGMFYVSAFQTGIDHFICPSVHKGAEALSFLQKRISSPKKDIEATVLSKVMEAFQAFRLSSAKEDRGFTHAAAFLSSLLGAMHHKAAMLNIMALPDPAEITEVVAPELAAPLIQLIGQLKPLAQSAPVPISTIDRSNVICFQILLESDTFAAYSESHAALTNAKKNSVSSMANIRKFGGVLIKESKRRLTPKPALIHVLNIVPKVIDTVFGKLPGALAQLAGNVAQDRLNDHNQIVIYQFDHWMGKVSAMRRKPTEADS
jgi:hypothetical protein